MPLKPITPCPCCGKFSNEGCLNIDHNECQTKEWNELAIRARGEGEREEFHQKQHNGFMYNFHKDLRLGILAEMKRIEITA